MLAHLKLAAPMQAGRSRRFRSAEKQITHTARKMRERVRDPGRESGGDSESPAVAVMVLKAARSLHFKSEVRESCTNGQAKLWRSALCSKCAQIKKG
jgi:hypothetical protein